jgi:hypothetical protein
MIYGRTHAPRQRIAGSDGDVFIYYEAYCNGNDSSGTSCKKSLLPDGEGSISTDDPRWFTNNNHIGGGSDGAVGTIAQKNGATDVTKTALDNTTLGKAKVTLHYDGTKGYPYKTTMTNTPNSWLIYNKYNSGASVNEFEVEFTDTSNTWAGEHETDNTTNVRSSDKTNRRTMW